jgi:hypothetical protein
MASLGLQGVIRGKPVRTTISDKAAPCPLAHVNRQFHAPRPNALWSTFRTRAPVPLVLTGPTYQRLRARLAEGLRKAGMPE